MVASIEQTVPDAAGVGQARKQTFGLDASGRVSVTKSFTAGVELAESQDHYDDSADSPAWTQTKTRTDGEAAWETTWQRYLSSLGGGLGLSVDDAGVVKVQLANLHGDIVSTLTIGQSGLDSYSESDEYGRASDPAAAQPRYGWLGVHQRDTGGTLAGLTLMGARLYNPVSGRFLSIDPVPGGNDNRYTYPCDPVNRTDLNGEFAIVVVLGVVLIFAIIVVAAGYASTPAYQRLSAANARYFGSWLSRAADGLGRLTLRMIAAAVKATITHAKKHARASAKEASTDAPSYAKGERIRPGETLEEAVKRVMGHRYPKTNKEKRASSDYSKVKKYLSRRR